MKRILPFLLAAPIAVYAFACSSSDSNSTNTNPDGGTGTVNPDDGGAGGTLDGGGSTAQSGVNPTTGATVSVFSNPAAAVHGMTWVPAQKALFAALPTSTVAFDGTPDTATTIGKIVRIGTDGQGTGILAGTTTTGALFSAAFDAKTNKVIAVGTSQLLTLDPAGTTLVTGTVFSTSYAGGADDAGAGPTAFAGLNDVIVKKDGTAYVTEPYYPGSGAVTQADNDRVYYVTTAGAAKSLTHYENNERPNGIALSPNEKVLYVSLTDPTTANPGRNLPVYGEYPAIWQYPVNDDGSLGTGSKFAQVGTAKSSDLTTKPDGLVVDEAGNVYVGTVQGVVVFKPTGEVWGTIATPEQIASLAWGGDDLKTLYLGSSNDPNAACDPAAKPTTPPCDPAKNTGSIYKATMPIAGIVR